MASIGSVSFGHTRNINHTVWRSIGTWFHMSYNTVIASYTSKHQAWDHNIETNVWYDALGAMVKTSYEGIMYGYWILGKGILGLLGGVLTTAHMVWCFSWHGECNYVFSAGRYACICGGCQQYPPCMRKDPLGDRWPHEGYVGVPLLGVRP